MSTPCEERGWKVGDKFTFTATCASAVGEVVELICDDGTDMPKFRDRFKSTFFARVSDVTPLAENTEDPDESEPEAEDSSDFAHVAAEQNRMEEEAEADAMIARYERELHEGVGTQAHYMECAIQPIDFIVENGLDFLEGNVIKYVARYKRKNGLEDLQKAQQYLTWLIEREERGGAGA